MFNYGIGGNERPKEVSEGISDIPQNKTLVIEKLTDDPAVMPEIVTGLKNINEVFEHFKPSKEVEFTDAEGAGISETLRFKGIADFSPKGIIAQSNYMQELNMQFEDLQKFIKQLKSNKILQTLLNNPEAKAAYIQGLQAMMEELE